MPDTCPPGFRKIMIRAYTNGFVVTIPEQPGLDVGDLDDSDGLHHSCERHACEFWEKIHPGGGHFLHRSTRSIYSGDYRAARWHEWSFAAPPPATSWDRTTTQLSRNKIPVERTFTHLRAPPESFVVVVPALSRVVEINVSESDPPRKVTRLAFHGEAGIDAESVWSLASKGERGFRLEQENASCEANTSIHSGLAANGAAGESTTTSSCRSNAASNGCAPDADDRRIAGGSGNAPTAHQIGEAIDMNQPNLFGDEAPVAPGAYGRRPARVNRVAKVAEDLAAHAAQNDVAPWMPPSPAASPDAKEACAPSPPVESSDSYDRSNYHEWPTSKLFEHCTICDGTMRIDPSKRMCLDPPDLLAKAARNADGSIVCPFCNRGFVETGLTVGQVERMRAKADKFDAMAKPSPVAQHDVINGGHDPVVDVERAIGHIRQGSGVTAIAILLRTVEVMKAGDVPAKAEA